MRRGAIVGVGFVGLLAMLAMLATATGVAADSRFRGHGGTSLTGHHRAPALHAHRFEGHRGFPRHRGGLRVVIAAPVVVYTPPLFTGAVPAFTAPMYAPAVTQHPTGRYELRGGGFSTPYNWVWIPNPPPPPPAPPAPPAGTPSGASTSGEGLPTREQVYQWVDDRGVAHWTNRVDRVPRRHREEARQ
jgi:hypothetical protein